MIEPGRTDLTADSGSGAHGTSAHSQDAEPCQARTRGLAGARGPFFMAIGGAGFCVAVGLIYLESAAYGDLGALVSWIRWDAAISDLIAAIFLIGASWFAARRLAAEHGAWAQRRKFWLDLAVRYGQHLFFACMAAFATLGYFGVRWCEPVQEALSTVQAWAIFKCASLAVSLMIALTFQIIALQRRRRWSDTCAVTFAACPACGYPIGATQSARCPECGAPVAEGRATQQ